MQNSADQSIRHTNSDCYPNSEGEEMRRGIIPLPYSQHQVKSCMLMGVAIVALVIDEQERLCLAQISNTLLKKYSYNEIHNRRVALGITCVQCTPVQLEILRRAGAMPLSSRRCGMITRREAERLCKSFLTDNEPPKLPENFAFSVEHQCAWGCIGKFVPSRYNSSRAKCIKCDQCSQLFSPNKFIFHSHKKLTAKYTQPNAANFNSWRRHLTLVQEADNTTDDLVHAWEDVKAMFNGGSRKRLTICGSSGSAYLSPQDADNSSMDDEYGRDNSPKSTEQSTTPVSRVRESALTTNDDTSRSVPAPRQLIPIPPVMFDPQSLISQQLRMQQFPVWPYGNPFGPMGPVNRFMFGMPPTQALIPPPAALNLVMQSKMDNAPEEVQDEALDYTSPKKKLQKIHKSEKESTLSKEHLKELLSKEMEARKQLEHDFRQLKKDMMSKTE